MLSIHGRVSVAGDHRRDICEKRPCIRHSQFQPVLTDPLQGTAEPLSQDYGGLGKTYLTKGKIPQDIQWRRQQKVRNNRGNNRGQMRGEGVLEQRYVFSRRGDCDGADEYC